MLWLSEDEVGFFFHQVVRQVARELQLQDWEWRSPTELLGAICESDAVLFQKLVAFVKAYNQWYAFHLNKEQFGNAVWSQQEGDELNRLILKRDSARSELLKQLRH